MVVVGGGVDRHRARALDAASRGLSVALVEARDFAAGTSSRSSKLIHGGLRYLEQMEFHLVREALRERSLLLNVIAPHLVSPVSFLLPARAPRLGARLRRRRDAALRRARRPQGDAPPPPSDQARGAEAGAGAGPDSLVGALQYDDCQVDDARHTLAVARTAARFGAAVANSASVIGFLREAGRVTGVRVRDHVSGRRVRGPRPRRDQRHRGVDRRAPAPARRARQVPRHRLQGHPPGRPPRPAPARHRADPAHREERPVRDPLGAALADRHHRHRVEARQGPSRGQPRRHRLRARAPQRRARPSRSATTTSRASTPACDRCCPASPRTPAGSAASTRSPCPCPGWWPWPAASTRPTASWLATPSTPPPAAWTRCVAAVGHRRHAADRRRRLPRPVERPPQARRQLRAARGADRAPAAPSRDAHARAAGADRRPARADPSRSPAPTTTWPSRPCTPPRTRAPCTSTTSSPGAPGSRSRAGTAARRPPSRSRA